VVFSSTIDKVDWNARLVAGDAVAEITRLKAEDGGPMRAGGATLAESLPLGRDRRSLNACGVVAMLEHYG